MEKSEFRRSYAELESVLLENINEYNIITKQSSNQKFSQKAADFFEKTDYFSWILRNSHGYKDYLVWSTDSESHGSDVCAIKTDNMITYKHMPGHGWHNIMIQTSQILSSAIAGYSLTNNHKMEKIVEQYSRGITATMKGMVYDNNDELEFLMARNIIPESHFCKTFDKKNKFIDYSDWRSNASSWNTQRFNYKSNPYYGDIYVTNTRSKDDLPHIFRAAALMPFFIKNAKNTDSMNAAIEAYCYLKGFCHDIIESGYKIRTKNESGKPFMPKGDLANLMYYGKNSETCALIPIALLAKGNLEGLKIKTGKGGIYEFISTQTHYYSYMIFNEFHLTSLMHSLNFGINNAAEKLMKGLKKRASSLMNSSIHNKARLNPKWGPDLAVFLLKAGALGMELNEEHKKIIFHEYSKAIDAYNKFSRWNMWSEEVPNGIYGSIGGFKPLSQGLISPELMGTLLEYCHSPYKKGESIIDEELLLKNF